MTRKPSKSKLPVKKKKLRQLTDEESKAVQGGNVSTHLTVVTWGADAEEPA